MRADKASTVMRSEPKKSVFLFVGLGAILLVCGSLMYPPVSKGSIHSRSLQAAVGWQENTIPGDGNQRQSGQIQEQEGFQTQDYGFQNQQSIVQPDHTYGHKNLNSDHPHSHVQNEGMPALRSTNVQSMDRKGSDSRFGAKNLQSNVMGGTKSQNREEEPSFQVHSNSQEQQGGRNTFSQQEQPHPLSQEPQIRQHGGETMSNQHAQLSQGFGHQSQSRQQGGDALPNQQDQPALLSQLTGQQVGGTMSDQQETLAQGFGQKTPPNGIQAQQEKQVPPVNRSPNGALPQCGVSVPEERQTTPTWTASYPGSGAKLTWKLVRGITGLWTSDDHDHNGRVESGVVAAVKTHFPSHTPAEVFFKPNLRHIQRAVLILRNPLTSIPSYHNFVYEQMNNLVNHSTRAPVDVWLKWRDEFYFTELTAWVNHAQYWIDNYDVNKFFLLPFEHLTADGTGVATLTELSAFFRIADDEIGKHMAPVEQLPCIWEMYVRGKGLGSVETKKRHSHREGGPSEYPYTNIQLDTMIGAIVRFRDTNPSVFGLVDLLNEYIEEIESKKAQQGSNGME